MSGHLELEGIAKRFGGTEVMRDVSLSIPAGELAVFVGPSGSGKSTLLRMIAGLETPSAGTVRLDGRDVTRADPARRGMAMVFQSYALYPHMSVAENLAFGLEMSGVDVATREARVREVARTLEIEPLLERRPRQLSGGQRQRVAIGRAIAREPTLFLFDEPLSNLDAELRVRMRMELSQLHSRLGSTMVYVTHDQVEAMTLADRIVVLRDGTIEQVGTPMTLYNDPDTSFVAGFIGAPRMNLLEATLAGREGEAALVDVPALDARRLRVALRDPSRAPPPAITFGVRPEDLVPAAVDGQGDGRRVELVERLGNQTHLHFAGSETVTVELRGQPDVRAGARMRPTPRDGAGVLFGADGRRL